MSKLTIETLEKMFLYLGCANITTDAAMDGAIPLESLHSTGSKTIAQLELSSLEIMPADWSTRAVWFSGESLSLATVENIHWTRMQSVLSRYLKSFQRRGECGAKVLTGDSDGYIKMYYSEINKHGRFEKFPVERKWVGDVVVNKIYNPSWLFEFYKERMLCLHSDSNEMYSSRKLDFLTPFMCGLAQSMDNHWQVKTKFDDICPSLTLLTDPTGVKEFWKLRDIPAGRKRRDALLHWVDQHWRQTRNDPDVEVFVRKHMRGSEDISQGQFRAKIVASKRDKLDVEIAKTDRERMRKLKTDRRKRQQILDRKLKG
jgi:hypothetical protein